MLYSRDQLELLTRSLALDAGLPVGLGAAQAHVLVGVELVARHAGGLEVLPEAEAHDGRELVHVGRVGRGALRRGRGLGLEGR